MSIILVASFEPRVGRSLIAAAMAFRLGRDGKPVTLARLRGDDSAEDDAATFAALEYIASPAHVVSAAGVTSLAGDVVLEVPPGQGPQLAESLGARVVHVGVPSSPAPEVPRDKLAAVVVTCVPWAAIDAVRKRADVRAVIAEDRILAAPSISDIGTTLQAKVLVKGERTESIDRVMIGTIASDAASPYFANREGTCVITRFDKTDVQLAALLTDIRCLVITGGGEPSPYLIDRVANGQGDVSVLLAPESTGETMRAIEGIFAASRFDGAGKLERAVALLDAENFSLEL